MLIFISLYTLILGLVIISKAFSQSSLYVRLFQFPQVADMKFNLMNVSLLQSFYANDSAALPTVVSSKISPKFSETHWEFGTVAVPYTVNSSKPYNLTVNYQYQSFNYTSTY